MLFPTSVHKHAGAAVLWIAVNILFAVAVQAGAKNASAVPQLEELTIVSGEHRHVLQVELARSDEELARGLMFRRQIGDDYGMLFDFRTDRRISMWMHNTYVYLDMLFIDKDGVIRKIHERAKPLDDTIINSGGPVRAVLEIRGGGAAARGLKVGDQVEHPMFQANPSGGK